MQSEAQAMAQHDRGSALILEAVSRRFGGVPAVDNVSLSLAQGEIACLVGRSGCGKSTLLRLISGIDRPDGGRIWLNGEQVAGTDRFVEPEARKIGFMFQDYALFPHLTVGENIAFGLKGLGRQAVKAQVGEVVERIGIAALENRYPHTLSGGEQQRVALARALAPKPVLLLMDEPFSNLDRGLREKLREETLRHLRALDATAIMVTHDPEEALSAGDKVVLMREGRVEQQASPRDLYRHPATLYAAQFLSAGTPVKGHVRNGSLETPLGRFAAPHGTAEGAAATAYLRPQTLSLASPDAPASVTGKLISRLFLGERDDLSIAVNGIDTPLRLHADGDNALRPGDAVAVIVDTGAVPVFTGGER